MNELQRLQQVFESLTTCEYYLDGEDQILRLSTAWREETERQHADLLDTVRSTANVQVPFNVQGVCVLLQFFD
jgi:hypothetical protein